MSVDMRFVIPSRNLKVFSKIIQCMAKIGDDLFLDVKTDKLVMRTLNNARSAFVSISFSKNFFEHFSVSDGEKKYQMKAKPCHAVFHNINNAEKCTIRLDEDEQRLVFDLPCKRGIKKTSKLAFEQCEPLQAIYQKDNCGNKIIARPKQLSDNLPNFHSHLDEITICLSKDGMRIKSYTDDAKGANAKILQTELHMDASDFEEFVTEGNVIDVTFSLKEFKAIIGLCEVVGQPCSILIEKGGRPMCVSLKYFNLFEADFVLATLVTHADLPSSQTSTSSDSSAAYSPSPIHITSKQKPTPSPMSSLDARSPMDHSSSNHSPPGASPMSYDASNPYLQPLQTNITAILTDLTSPHSYRSPAPGQRRTYSNANDQDEYVSGSPQSSPKKVQKVDGLSKMLGGRDLDAEYDDDYDMMDENGDTIPSSA